MPIKRRVHFVKYHGAGNDYIYIDLAREEHHFLLTHIDKQDLWIQNFIRCISRRRFGVGSDGVIFIGPGGDGAHADAEMIMHNLDGSQGRMCGNGLRCTAAYAFSHLHDGGKRDLKILTACGVKDCRVIADDNEIAKYGLYDGHVDREKLVIAAGVGRAQFSAQSIPVLCHSNAATTAEERARAFYDHLFATSLLDRIQRDQFVSNMGRDDSNLLVDVLDLENVVHGFNNVDVFNTKFPYATLSMGNPHCVIFVNDVDHFDVETTGSLIEGHTVMWPDRTNVMFVQVVVSTGPAGDETLTLKTRPYERGSGQTLACGSGACAVGVVACLFGLVHPAEGSRNMAHVRVQMPGGILVVQYDTHTHDVKLVGEAVEVFQGTVTCEI